MNDQVQLLVTCLIDSLFPEVGEAVLDVLTRVGLETRIPSGQTCCGQPAYNAGFREEARRMARYTLEKFGETQGPVVVPSGSCAAMIRHGYLELFTGDEAWYGRALELARRTFEFSEFLVDCAGVVDLGVSYPARLAYHPSCHLLRGLGVDRQPWSLLQAVEQAEVVRLSADCCGFGGVFAVDQPEISGEMLERRIGQIEASGAQAVVSCDVSCLMHLEGGLRAVGSQLRCVHLAQVLAGDEAGLR